MPKLCNLNCYIQSNLDLTKCRGSGKTGSLYRGFVISRVRYIENFDSTNLRKNNQIVRYIDGWMTIFFYFFKSLKIFCGVLLRYSAFS